MRLTRYFIIPSIHPLLPMTACFILGIAGQQQWKIITYSHYGYVILAALLGAALFAKKIRYILLSVTFLCAGVISHATYFHSYDSFHEHVSGKVQIRAVIDSIEPIDHPWFNYQVMLCLHAVKQPSSPWQEKSGNIRMYVKEELGACTADLIECNISIKKPSTDSFAQYLYKEGCVAFVCAPSLNCIILKHASSSIPRFLSDVRHAILNKLKNVLSGRTFAVVSSIFLGNRMYVKKDMDRLKHNFKTWGISHYLARSGLHVVLFVMLWHFLLSLLPLAFILKQFLLIALVMLYALLSWSSISFTRALLMFLLCKIPALFGYQTHYVHIITLATLAILITNPLQLFFLDFQLSFGFTFALAWFGQLEAEKKRTLVLNT